MKMFTVEVWEATASSACRRRDAMCARGTWGAWKPIGESDDFRDVEQLFVTGQQSGRAVRFTANPAMEPIRP